jgi:hypothetical protein
MNHGMRGFLTALVALALNSICGAASPAAASPMPFSSPIYVIANQDLGFPFQNQISIFLAGGTNAAPLLTLQNAVGMGGHGIAGGYFGTARLNSVPDISATCLYVSNAGDNDIASVSLVTQQLAGNFSGSQTDDGSANGIGLAVNRNYLYASFTSSNTIGAFSLQPGCGLTFLGDVSAIGLQGGSVTGMAVNGTMLVVAYGDGSIQSFSVSSGLPVSNNDLQNSAGYTGAISTRLRPGSLPSGVDITRDGRFAIFGDISAPAVVVEVSNLRTGKLDQTIPYNVGRGVDAGAVRLSPDESLLYIANSEGGTVMAAFFDAKTGKIAPGCRSIELNGFNARPWFGSVVARDPTGTGNVLYVAEYGRPATDHGPASAIGIVSVTSNGASCTLSESVNSPESLFFPGTLSIGAYPPRPF